MTTVDPSLFELAPSPQDLLAEAQVAANLPGAISAPGGPALSAQESPAELADDALVEFTSAAQNWFNTEHTEGVPNSVISVQSMISTLVGSMTADATEAMATAAQMDPGAALSLTQL